VLYSLASVAASSAAPAAQARDRDGAPPGPPPAQPDVGTAPRDRVTLSAEAQERASGAVEPGKGQDEPGKVQDQAAEKAGDKPAEKPGSTAQDRTAARAGGKLTSDQERQLGELRQRDTHVRQHEAAHQAAGGALVGGASYSYQTGPDGRSYAVGGEVPISMPSGRTPDETIAIAQRVRAAALAPSDPSAQDLSVAAAATSIEMAASARRAREAVRAYGKNAGTAKPPGEREPQGTTQRAAAPAPAQAA
jgi:hypothetical protein